MKNLDILMNKDEIRAMMQKAVAENDSEKFTESLNQMMMAVGEEIKAEYDSKVDGLKNELDTQVLNARGVRQLTSTERQYYQKLGEAMKAPDVKQALTNTDLVMPETVLDAVFDELQTRHELLSRIDFVPTKGAIEMMLNTNGLQKAAWGKLCSTIVQEIASGFDVVNTSLLKLSAFIPVCKATLELGPEWLDSYIRQVLYEALANGLEAGIVNGNGKDAPIGMVRQVGDSVNVVGGEYPAKAAIKVNDLTPATLGNLLSIIAADPNGKPREVRDVILLVNPQDYFLKVMPATTLLAPDGTYRNDVLPYPITIIQSNALARNQAVIGMSYKYFAAAGMNKGGRIEYSDEYKFIEDERTYIIKLYANGFPMDNNAFLHLDISGLRPATYKVEQTTAPEPSQNANLSDLKLGAVALSPTFAEGDKTYTATTTNVTNTVTAYPADAGATIVIKHGSKVVENGSAITWNSGSNTVTVDVTAADGTTKVTYTVTVTKQ